MKKILSFALFLSLSTSAFAGYVCKGKLAEDSESLKVFAKMRTTGSSSLWVTVLRMDSYLDGEKQSTSFNVTGKQMYADPDYRARSAKYRNMNRFYVHHNGYTKYYLLFPKKVNASAKTFSAYVQQSGEDYGDTIRLICSLE